MNDKTKRTSSYKAQKSYDRMLADCNISSLRFLSEKYDKELDNYKEQNDITQKENFREYRNIQQRKKMIDEELTVRLMNESATTTKSTTYFDSNTGLIYGEYSGDILGTADFDENEECINVRNFDGDIVLKYNEPQPNQKKKRKDIYEGWEY